MYKQLNFMFQQRIKKAKQELKYERTKKTGRNRCEAATLLASVITLFLLFSESAELLCNSICFAYPAVKSLEKWCCGAAWNNFPTNLISTEQLPLFGFQSFCYHTVLAVMLMQKTYRVVCTLFMKHTDSRRNTGNVPKHVLNVKNVFLVINN
ncbi:receptor expression-enhancing protein 6 [Trichinella spiralis]|uniref:receptor expression-enhancing protein 6 n=1 Tax=Trichinella spiralis TaxID=6334 RepID=UPI0001EFC54F|nr:receptor expression-enhancing protein 6 [Trichinella spiralis]